MKLCSQGLLLFVIFTEIVKGGLPSRYERCHKPTLINGEARLVKRGRTARFKCNASFQLVGEKYATCLRSQWDTIPICVKTGCVSLPTFNNGQKIETYRGAVVKFICNPGYSMTSPVQIHCDGSIWNSSLPRCSASTKSSPTTCDFESLFICGWSQDPFHTFNWSRQNYRTPSRNLGTGPLYDHTLGANNSGYFMFIETSSPRIENDTARLFSPVFSYTLTVTEPSCFIFWYHMYGTSTGTLNIYVKPESIIFDSTFSPTFTKSGNQGDKWFQGIVQLPKLNESFQVIVEALRGSSYAGDIAIDDVKITNGSECIAEVTIATESPFQNTVPQWLPESIRPGRYYNFTFPPSPPLPSLPPIPSFTERETTLIPTYTYRRQLSTMTSFNPPHHLVESTTEESKFFPIPSEPTPLIIPRFTGTIRRFTKWPTTPSVSNATTSRSTAMPKTNTTMKSTTMKITTIPTTVPTTTTLKTTSKTTTKLTTKFLTTRKPPFTLIQTPTTKRTILQSTRTYLFLPSTITRTTKKPVTFPTTITTKIKPNVPSILPDLETEIPSTQKPIQEKIITSNVKEEPHVTTEMGYITANTGKIPRGKKWIEARRGPVPERKSSLSVSSIAGILVAVALVIVAVTIAAYFYLKHRKQAHRQSCIAEDSDVRFLTSEEVLDFNLARPSDSGEDDL